ncbi:hypothetical protein OHR68_09685 [Spirillospora sp. NBC_00431]
MINEDLSVHTHGDRDPAPILHTTRYVSTGLGMALLVIGVILLTAGVGAGHEGLRVMTAGLTLIGLAGMCGVVAVGASIGEQIDRRDTARVCALGEEFSALAEDVGALSREIRSLASAIDSRLKAVEAGERSIAGALKGLPGPPDELGPRRSG